MGHKYKHNNVNTHAKKGGSTPPGSPQSYNHIARDLLTAVPQLSFSLL